MDNSKIVTIQTFDSESKAIIAKGILESSGIQSELIHQTIQSILPLGGRMTQIELCVAAEDEQQALDIIAAKFDENEFREETHTQPKPRRKCACGPQRK